MWLECIDVVSGCCSKEVYRCPHNPYRNNKVVTRLWQPCDKVVVDGCESPGCDNLAKTLDLKL